MRLLVTDEKDRGFWVEAEREETFAHLRTLANEQAAAKSPAATSYGAVGDEHVRCVLLRTGTQLSLSMPLMSTEVEDGDEILMLKTTRQPQLCFNAKVAKDECPTREDVDAFTADLPAQNRQSTQPPEVPVDLPSVLQQTHLSLTEFAGRLQSLLATEDGHDGEEGDSEDEGEAADDGGSKVDARSVNQLADMGFPREWCIKALRLSGLDQEAAAEWLLVNALDPSIDEPLPVTPPRPKRKKQRGRWRPQEFVPSQSAMHNLKSMGFEEAIVVAALKATGNNQEEACELLLSNVVPEEPKPLDKESPLYKELFSNPVVLNGLSSPAILSALVQLLDSPDRLPAFLNHKDCGMFLVAVTRVVQRHMPQDA